MLRQLDVQMPCRYFAMKSFKNNVNSEGVCETKLLIFNIIFNKTKCAKKGTLFIIYLCGILFI